MNEEVQKPPKIDIQDKDFSRELVQILMGDEDADSLNEEWIPIAEAIEDPDRLPFLVSEITEMEKTNELRQALVRVQINAQLKRSEALDLYKKQLFAATTIEILLYGRLRLKPKPRKKKKDKSGEEPSEESSMKKGDEEEREMEED